MTSDAQYRHDDRDGSDHEHEHAHGVASAIRIGRQQEPGAPRDESASDQQGRDVGTEAKHRPIFAQTHPKPQNRSVRIRRSPSSRDGGVRRILVATDRSQSADRAVRWAADMAERYEAELLVLQVVAERAAAVLPELEQFAESLGARALVETAEDPSDAIVRAAEQEKVDVLVVGNVGMSGRREFLLGNVPNRVSHNAPCTVVIVDTSSERR
jgi:nucleotide-binding universal stress UspA family protein